MRTAPPSLLARRIAAYLADSCLIFLYVLLLVAASAALDLATVAATIFADPLLAQGFGILTLTLPAAIFLSLCESSRRMATPGKRLLGIHVTGPEGRRLGRARAFARSALKLLPWEAAHVLVWRMPPESLEGEAMPLWIPAGLCAILLLVIVYLLLPLLTPRDQSLHDLLAGTIVRRNPSPPGESPRTMGGSRFRGVGGNDRPAEGMGRELRRSDEGAATPG